MQAKLIDLNGQVISTTTQGNIHVNNIVEGIYFLEVITTEGRLTEKIIIRKQIIFLNMIKEERVSWRCFFGHSFFI